MTVDQLLPGLFRVTGPSNVYLIKEGSHAVVVDYGSGQWHEVLPELGIDKVDHVFVTHPHRHAVQGLERKTRHPSVLHAPIGSRAWLSRGGLARIAKKGRLKQGCPDNYDVPSAPVGPTRYDMAGFTDLAWRGRRIRFILTPGHTPVACSVLMDVDGKQVVFCGDAVHAGATVHEPYHLEWDHWTGTGALAAWEGIERLAGLKVDLLCPSHGPAIDHRPRSVLRELAKKLMAFYRAKGQVSPGEPDRWLTMEPVAEDVQQLGEHLVQFGGNGWLLASRSGEALVVDPYRPDLPAMERAVKLLGVKPTAMIVSHYHYDHCDGIPVLQKKYGARAVLHPAVAEALEAPQKHPGPWLPDKPIHADQLLPARGTWQWNEYTFKVCHWPGQTWWHAGYQATVDGRAVFFGGDSFQPTSRWNGTGGFCALNGSRFEQGFAESCRTILDWSPDVVACGHGTAYRFSPSKFRKIVRWSEKADHAVRALCPTGDLEQDYYVVLKD